MNKKKHALTVFSLVMITVGSVDSIRNLPATALFGSELIIFFTFGAIFFLIPAALISAELASGWPQQGGIYIWVKESFGKSMGFLAIWLQWISNVIWYPTILSFVAGTIGYLINPNLVNNPYYLWLIIIMAFWGTTFINLCGMTSSALFSNICTILGLLLPMSMIIILGVIWLLSGNPMEISFKLPDLLPHFNSLWVSLTAIMLSFCGIEIATVHANDIRDPQHAFPKSLIYSVLIILSTLICGSLSIAMILPHNEINLVAGIMQAFDAFFLRYHFHCLMPYIAIMLVLGGLGSVSNWIIAPTKGLLIAAQDGNLPKIFQLVNKNGAPVFMLIFQAIVVTILSSLFIFMPSVNGSYWLLTVMAAQLYMLMYLLMFIAAIKLRWSKSMHLREFCISGGFTGLLIVAIMGIIGVILTFIVSFIPPNGINIGNVMHYEIILIAGLLLMCSPPLLISLR